MSLILYNNIIEGVTPTATNEVSTYEGVYCTNWLLYNGWKPGVSGTQSLTFDLTTAKSADCIAIYGHNLFTQGCSVQLKYSTDNVSYFDAFSVITPTADGVIFSQFTTQTARYWRLEVTNCTTDAVISVASFGDAFVLPSEMYDGFKPPVWGDYENTNSIAENGNFLGRSIKKKPFKMKITQKLVTSSFVRGDWLSFIRHAQTKPFFFSWSEASFPEETVYAWADKKISMPNYSHYERLTVDLNVMALRD